MEKEKSFNKIAIKKNTKKSEGLGIVLFKSIRKCKRRNKGNFTSKSNSNKIMLCGGQHFVLCFLAATKLYSKQTRN